MRFFGKVGFSCTSDEPDEMGLIKETLEEREYYGDILKNSRRWENGVSINDNLLINNQFSIVADSFAYRNLGAMRYVVYHGNLWKITNVEIERPRIVITVGGIYNAEESI